jgi:hypothetical protein
MGLKIGSPRKGSVTHESIIYYAEKSLKRYRPDFKFERTGVSRTLNGVQPDSLLLLPDGARVPIQACHRNQPDYEAKRILDLHGLALLDRSDPGSIEFVIVVTSNKQHRGAIERAVKGQNKGKMPDKLALLDFDTVTDAGFNWAEVFTMTTG